IKPHRRNSVYTMPFSVTFPGGSIMRMQKGLRRARVFLAFFIAPIVLVGLGLGKDQAQERKLKFEIYQDAAKEFRWRLKAGNGEPRATAGQGYKAKADCTKGVDRIKDEAGSNKVKFETYQDTSKEYRWRCKAANGQVVASSSQGYKAKADCEHAVDL